MASLNPSLVGFFLPQMQLTAIQDKTRPYKNQETDIQAPVR